MQKSIMLVLIRPSDSPRVMARILRKDYPGLIKEISLCSPDTKDGKNAVDLVISFFTDQVDEGTLQKLANEILVRYMPVQSVFYHYFVG